MQPCWSWVVVTVSARPPELVVDEAVALPPAEAATLTLAEPPCETTVVDWTVPSLRYGRRGGVTTRLPSGWMRITRQPGSIEAAAVAGALARANAAASAEAIRRSMLRAFSWERGDARVAGVAP